MPHPHTHTHSHTQPRRQTYTHYVIKQRPRPLCLVPCRLYHDDYMLEKIPPEQNRPKLLYNQRNDQQTNGEERKTLTKTIPMDFDKNA